MQLNKIKTFLFQRNTLSWTIFVLLFGVGYSTGYTSIMAKPSYTAVINTPRDFTSNNLKLLETFPAIEFSNLFLTAGTPDYERIGEEAVYERNRDKRFNMLLTEKYGVVAKVVNKNVACDDSAIRPIQHLFRTMTHCFFTYFTIIAFPKKSPYINLFNNKIAM